MTLEIARTIRPQIWMKTPGVKTLMALLNDSKTQAFFVGGCVRNALLGEEVEDVDIAAQLLPDQVMERLSAEGIKVVPTGITHGTVTAVLDGQPFEITTLRRDVETDGRRAVVTFTRDWQEDAQRRDFTMNTLLADMDGHIYDPLGTGLADLEARRVVFVGKPGQRIAEDYLRILRFFRFHAFYGKGAPDEAALKACRAAADKIETLSRERITQEFLKILSIDVPTNTLNLMFENNVLKEFLFSEYEEDLLKHLCVFQKRYGLAFIAARLFVLAGLKLGNIEDMEELLLLPKVFRKDMDAIHAILGLEDLSDDRAVKTAIYKYGRVPTAQALMIELAQDRVMNGYAPKALDLVQNWDIPDFPVSGEDLLKAGHKPGPALGEKLAELEEEWIRGGFIMPVT
ncbi:MAG: CCA tRNA nucleotidyltransferase [Alphaproteobacteria bacterium]|nr:CCA tRNA nucleotidyltransferase [Alphaproteobacteria bacterium]